MLNMEPLNIPSRAVPTIHYITPAILLVLYNLSTVLHPHRKRSQKGKHKHDFVSIHSSLPVLLPSLGILFSFLLQSALVLNCQFPSLTVSLHEELVCLTRPADHVAINSFASFLVWSVVLFDKSIFHSFFNSILGVAAVSELLLLSFNSQLSREMGRLLHTCSVVRLSLLVALLLFTTTYYSGIGGIREYVADLPVWISNESEKVEAEDNDSPDSETSTPPEFDDGGWEENAELERLIRKSQKERFTASASWWEYIKPFRVLLRFSLPQRNAKVFTLIGIDFLLVILRRAVPPLLTRQQGIITDNLLVFTKTTTNDPSSSSSEITSSTLSTDVAIWLALTWMSSRGGLSAIAYLVKIPMENMSTKALNLAAYDHLMSLSADFHDSMNPADVMTSITYKNPMYHLFRKLFVALIPAVFDMIIGGVYLYTLFGPYAAFTLVVAAYAYTVSDVYFKHWAMHHRRASNKAFLAQWNAQNRAMQGWRAVRYFNNFSFERQRVEQTLDNKIDTEMAWQKVKFLDLVSTDNIMTIGLVPVCIIAINSIRAGNAPVGHFVAMTSIWFQLLRPLAKINGVTTDIVESLVDVERILYIFGIKPDIVDAPDAKPLQLTKGDVTFKQASFAYDTRKTVLNSISINNTAGRTIALVGESGGGKSTILQLISRVYEVSSGAIQIDGQDLRSVTQASLRAAIGVVPQSPFMFNTSILENLRYAMRGSDTAAIEASPSTSASTDAGESKPMEEELGKIYTACRAASIHDKILTFPDGYDSLVGENGVKLSGGELQRVAIAQVLLQNPRLVLLDEATSAVDTLTERQIQAALRQLVAGRTAFVIAHRLSTIVGADEILVVHQGEIVERGTHTELLKNESGRYKALWEGQVLAAKGEL